MERLIPLSQIHVPSRARVDYGDVTDLAKKILATKGLKFNYVTVEQTGSDTYTLLAGGRRLKAYELLVDGNNEVWGLQPTEDECLHYHEIPCTVLTDLTEEDRIRVELVENLSRKDFTWPEASSLVTAFHVLMQEKYGKGTSGRAKTGWSTRDTARELGLNSADVVYYLQLNKALLKDSSLGDIRSRSKALTKLKRGNQELIAELLDIDGYSFEDIRIECGDSKIVIPTLPDNSVDMVVTDPPWGINFENSISQDRRDSATTNYDTGYDVTDTLEILTHCYSKMKPNTPIYMFYAVQPEKALEGQRLLTLAGFVVEKIPLIWYKKHILAHQSQETRHGLNYEIILYAYKEERPFFNHSQRDVFEFQVAFANRIHASEKPEGLLVDIIKLHGKEGDMVLDPWGGSCKVADACKTAGRKCLVVELEESLVKMATLRVRGI